VKEQPHPLFRIKNDLLNRSERPSREDLSRSTPFKREQNLHSTQMGKIIKDSSEQTIGNNTNLKYAFVNLISAS
jgi:hypothetical protein